MKRSYFGGLPGWLVLCAGVAFAVGCKSAADPEKGRPYPCNPDGGSEAQCPDGWRCGPDERCFDPDVQTTTRPCIDDSVCSGWHCSPPRDDGFGRCYDREDAGAVACRREPDGGSAIRDCATGWVCSPDKVCRDLAVPTNGSCQINGDCGGRTRCGRDSNCFDPTLPAPNLCDGDTDCATDAGWRCRAFLPRRCADTTEEGLQTLPDAELSEAGRTPERIIDPTRIVMGIPATPPLSPSVVEAKLFFATDGTRRELLPYCNNINNTACSSQLWDGGLVGDVADAISSAGITWLYVGDGGLQFHHRLAGPLVRGSQPLLFTPHSVEALSPNGEALVVGATDVALYRVSTGGGSLATGKGPGSGTLPILEGRLIEAPFSPITVLVRTADGLYATRFDGNQRFWVNDFNGNLANPDWLPISAKNLPHPACDGGRPLDAPVGLGPVYNPPTQQQQVLVAFAGRDGGSYEVAYGITPSWSTQQSCRGDALLVDAVDAGVQPLCAANETMSAWRQRFAECVSTLSDGGSRTSLVDRFGPVYGSARPPVRAVRLQDLQTDYIDAVGNLYTFSVGTNRSDSSSLYPTVAYSGHPIAVIGGGDAGLVLVDGNRRSPNVESVGILHSPLIDLGLAAENVIRRFCGSVRNEPGMISFSALPLNGNDAFIGIARDRTSADAHGAFIKLQFSGDVAATVCVGLERGVSAHRMAAPEGADWLIISAADRLWAGRRPADGTLNTVIPVRLSPVPFLRITSLAPLGFARGKAWPRGFVLAGSRLFEFEAATEETWAQVELAKPPGVPFAVLGEGTRGRLVMNDGTVYSLPGRVQLSQPLTTPGDVVSVASFCGRTFVLKKSGLYYLDAVAGQPLGSWTFVPLSTSRPGSSLPRFNRGLLHAEGGKLVVADDEGTVVTLRDGSCQ